MRHYWQKSSCETSTERQEFTPAKMVHYCSQCKGHQGLDDRKSPPVFEVSYWIKPPYHYGWTTKGEVCDIKEKVIRRIQQQWLNTLFRSATLQLPFIGKCWNSFHCLCSDCCTKCIIKTESTHRTLFVFFMNQEPYQRISYEWRMKCICWQVDNIILVTMFVATLKGNSIK